MKFKKNGLFRAIAGVFLSTTLIIAGCGGGAATGNGSEGGASNSTPAGETKQVVLKLGHVYSTGSPADLGAKKFAEIVEEKTEGAYKIEVFGDGQLGGDKQMLDSMKLGAVDMVEVGETAYSMAAPKYEGLTFPYLIRDQQHLLNVLNGEIGEELKNEFQTNLNATVLDWWIRSPRNLTANKEVKVPDDLKGVKIRVPEIPLYVETWKAFGATPSVMAFTEVFTSLEAGVIDAQETPLDTIYASKFNEVQKYMMKTEHTINPIMLFINTAKFNSFPAEIQQIFRDAAVEAGEYEQELVKSSEEEMLKELTEYGMVVVEVDKEQFRSKLTELEATLEGNWVPNLLDRVREVE